METINWHEYHSTDHVLAWFLSNAMSNVGIHNFGDFDSSKLVVNLTINGISVPITAVMDHLQSQLEQIRKEGIQEGREQKMTEIHDKISMLFGEESAD